MHRFCWGKLPQVRSLLRSHFLSGLLVVIPLGTIAWIALVALRALWGLRNLVPDGWRPINWVPNPFLAAMVDMAIVLGALVVLALGTSFLGWVSKQLLGQKILDLFAEHIVQRIPILRSVYGALEQLLRTMAQSDSRQFSRVVYVEYPRKGLWALAFVTAKVRDPALPPDHLNIYVPTTPNPTSGFHLIVPEADVRESNLSVEQAFKTILSLGIAQSGSGLHVWARADQEKGPTGSQKTA